MIHTLNVCLLIFGENPYYELADFLQLGGMSVQPFKTLDHQEHKDHILTCISNLLLLTVNRVGVFRYSV